MPSAIPPTTTQKPGPSGGVAAGVTGRASGAVSAWEGIALAAAVVIGIVALVSLALAHLQAHSLPAVVAVSVVVLVVLGGLAARFERITWRWDVPALWPLVAGVGLSALFFFPGFQYGTGDRDPGAYIEIGAAIARTHGMPFADPALAAHLPATYLPGEVWPALWVQPGHPTQIFPQFYHLWPALLATAKDAGGYTGMFDTGPLCGLVAVALAVVIGRRIAGLPGAWTAALVLPTNMLQVWQAKYPSAEIFGQLLFLGAVLGMVLAVRCGWRSAAAAGGVLLSLGYLERADGILLVLFAWVVLCALLAAGRFDARAGWFAGGLVVLLPYGIYQAYDIAHNYTIANAVPGLAKIVVGMAVALAVAGLLAWQRRRWRPLLDWASRRRGQLQLGTVFIVVCAVLVILGGLRPILFGKDYALIRGQRARTYNEISFVRLTWFFSLTGIALMCAGIAYVGWRRWRFDRWVIALATTGLLAVYCYNLRNSPYMMWSTRRFVTTVVPGMVLLMGCGAAGAVWFVRRLLTRIRVPARGGTAVAAVGLAALLIGLAAFGTSESWPLRSHNENGNSIELERQLTALSGDRTGVYLWQKSGACCAAPYELFGGPMFATMGQVSAIMPAPGPAEPGVIEQYVGHYRPAGQPIFYVANGKGSPPQTAGVVWRRVGEYAGTLPHWEETFTSRPKKENDYHYDITVYRAG